MSKLYTVILLYPDYASNIYGQEHYFTHVRADTAIDAVKAARFEAFEANNGEIEDEDDFALLWVLNGHAEPAHEEWQ